MSQKELLNEPRPRPHNWYLQGAMDADYIHHSAEVVVSCNLTQITPGGGQELHDVQRVPLTALDDLALEILVCGQDALDEPLTVLLPKLGQRHAQDRLAVVTRQTPQRARQFGVFCQIFAADRRDQDEVAGAIAEFHRQILQETPESRT